MNKSAEFYRVVVVRTAKGDKQYTARQPLMRCTRVPSMRLVPFDPEYFRPGVELVFTDYHWDGKETNVSGFPVYR